MIGLQYARSVVGSNFAFHFSVFSFLILDDRRDEGREELLAVNSELNYIYPRLCFERKLISQSC